MSHVYVVFAEADYGLSYHFLGVNSSPARAQRFVDEQDAQLRQCLVIREVGIDQHVRDPYWKVPPAAAFDLLAGMPEAPYRASGTTTMSGTPS